MSGWWAGEKEKREIGREINSVTKPTVSTAKCAPDDVMTRNQYDMVWYEGTSTIPYLSPTLGEQSSKKAM